MLSSALIILRKDARLRLRDRSVWMFAFIVPLALTLVFSLVLPSEEDFELSAGVVDLDGGQVAEGFTEGMLPAMVDDGFLTITSFPDEDAARRAIEEDRISVAWILSEGLSDRATSGQGGQVRVLVNPDHTLSAAVARGIADGFGSQIDRVSLAMTTAQVHTQGQLTAEQMEAVAAAAVESDPVVALDGSVADDRQLAPSSYTAAGMAIFFLFFTVSFGITGFLEERQQGTLPRLLAAPISAGAIHVAKALGAFVLGVTSMAVLAVASDLLLDAPWGPAFGVSILSLAAVVAALGVMALVGSFARTAEQAGNLQGIVAMVLGLAGGVFFPVGTGLLGTLALASPHGWFLRGLGDLSGSGSWTAVLPASAALVAFGIITAIPGALRIDRWGRV